MEAAINKLLSEAETQIMNAVWESGNAVTVNELIALFSDSKGWKSQTVSTFASRLVSKKFLTVEKRGKTNYYSPTMTKREYENSVARKLIDDSYDGSVKNLFAALVEGNDITSEEIRELKEMINNM